MQFDMVSQEIFQKTRGT